jgi:tRNA pseudouridine32 synthase / 23S rRNA pseudouridine746 synthase
MENLRLKIFGDYKVKYIDDDIIVVEKPAGLLSVPGKAEDNKDCLIGRVNETYPDALIVHRLDMATSGLMILPRNKLSERHISIQFQRRQITKQYIALLHGNLVQDEGLIDAPLICDWENRPRQKIDFDIGKPSQTIFKVVSRNENSTRVIFSPITGRSHQLRMHSIHIGHPICGDLFYIGNDGYDRLMLHASYLEFRHPISKEIIKFESNPDF